jgi:ketosteroid isomerase-like protein
MPVVEVEFGFELLPARGRTAIERVERMTRRAVPVALVMVLGLFASACGRSDPEKELRATVAAMAQAIEQHRVSDALEPVAEDFTRESGAFGKQDARRVLAGTMLRNERIQLSAVVTDVRVEGDRAFATVRVIATGGAGLLPERGQTWEFDSAWRREKGRWKVFNAEWREGL